ACHIRCARTGVAYHTVLRWASRECNSRQRWRMMKQCIQICCPGTVEHPRDRWSECPERDGSGLGQARNPIRLTDRFVSAPRISDKSVPIVIHRSVGVSLNKLQNPLFCYKYRYAHSWKKW